MIVQQGRIPQSWAPYFPEQSHFTNPPGYPSVIAFLYLLDPLVNMPVLVSLFSLFFVVIPGQIFVLTRKILEDCRVALCAAVFSVLLLIGFHKMIVMGLFPALVGLALTLNLLLFSYMYSAIGKRKLLLLAGITLASLFLTYSVSFITAALFVILFFSFGFIFSKRKKENLLGGTSIIVTGLVLSSPWVFNILNRMMIEVPVREYEALLIWFDIYSLRNAFCLTNTFMYYGYWLFLTGIAVLLLVRVRRRVNSFLFAWFFSIFLLMLNELFQIHFPGWYYLQTGVFLNPMLSLPLSVLAGIGFVRAYDLFKKILKKSSGKQIKRNPKIMLGTALLIFTVVLGAIVLFWKPEVTNDFLSNLHKTRISTADYNAIIWISNNTPEDAVIFNDHWIGTPSVWIPIISHRRVVMPLLSISEVGWSDAMFTRQDESVLVAKYPDSTAALDVLERYDVSYIFLSNHCSSQVQEWRNNFDAHKFLSSSHYELAFNEEDAWVIRVLY